MEERDFELRRNCTRFLSHHRPGTAAEILQHLARHPIAGRPLDYYGSGGAVAELERRVVGLLGKEAGLFSTSRASLRNSACCACAANNGPRPMWRCRR